MVRMGSAVRFRARALGPSDDGPITGTVTLVPGEVVVPAPTAA